jgi:hypothetical protein
MRIHLVAVAGVVDHHEQHCFLAQRFVLGVALARFFYAELQTVGAFFGEEGARDFVQARAAGGVGQYRVVEECAQPVEVGMQAVEHDDVGCE